MTFEATLEKIINKTTRQIFNEVLEANRLSHLPMALSPEQAAEQAGVSLSKMREWTRREDFPAIRDGGRIVIPTSLFAEWLEDRAKNQ